MFNTPFSRRCLTRVRAGLQWLFCQCFRFRCSLSYTCFSIEINHHIVVKLLELIFWRGLCEKVGDVPFSRQVSYSKLPLFYAVAEPIEANIHAFGSLCVYGVSSKSFGDGVVYRDDHGELWVTKFLQRIFELCCLLRILKCGAELSFSYRGNHEGKTHQIGLEAAFSKHNGYPVRYCWVLLLPLLRSL